MIKDHSSITKGFFDWLWIRLSLNTSVDGLWVGVFSEEQGEEILDRLCKALLLIKIYDPYRYKRVLREVHRIWAYLLPTNAGEWLPALKRCVVDPRFILSFPPEFIASTIVHEATHGRLMRYGAGYPESVRHRIERICMRQELAFASKIPDGSELRQMIEQSLALAPETWSDQRLGENRKAGEIEMASQAGIPDWVLGAALWIRERKSRRFRRPT